MNVNREWLKLLSVLSHAQRVDPQKSAGAAGSGSREVVAFKTVVDMTKPVVSIPLRKLGYKFMAAEAAWILSGDDRVETIAPYAKHITNYSDDGVKFFGAYGPRIVKQLDYVVDTLWADQDSRQAVIQIWRENPPATKDKPCTLEVQWLIRQGKLHCIDFMRSSDAWLGWPYDVFNFSMLSALIIIKLHKLGLNLGLGDLHLTAGSQHIYDRDFDNAQAVLNHWREGFTTLYEEYGPFHPLQHFTYEQQLIDELWKVADHKGALYWFKNLPPVGVR